MSKKEDDPERANLKKVYDDLVKANEKILKPLSDKNANLLKL